MLRIVTFCEIEAILGICMSTIHFKLHEYLGAPNKNLFALDTAQFNSGSKKKHASYLLVQENV